MTTIQSPGPLITHDPQASALWEKLRRFRFDRGSGPRTFAARLALEQGWSEAFTALAIEEYRRFLLLFALNDDPDLPGETAPVRIVPPAVVDKVWHLHLLYTQSYWEDLCRDILKRPLHHLPADGSSGEDAALDAVYENTLAAYRQTFGQPAPASIWPGAEPSENPPRGPALRIGAKSVRGFAGFAVLAGGGVFIVLGLVVEHVLKPGFLLLAVLGGVLLLAAANGRRAARGRGQSGDGGGSTGNSYPGDASGGGGTDPRHDGNHHDGGHHGGSHDAGGHSHSCGGGGHSCGGHGCGGHGCGGGGCGGH